jgi:acyl carrier protein
MKQLINLISNVLNVPTSEITLQSGPKNAANWDSLAHISIITAVEQTYDLQLTMPEMLGIKTVDDLRNLIEKSGTVLIEK